MTWVDIIQKYRVKYLHNEWAACDWNTHSVNYCSFGNPLTEHFKIENEKLANQAPELER